MATTEKDIIKEYPKAKEIADLIVGLGNKLKVDPMYLARTMNAETGGTFSPSKKNTAGSGATGLIQFTKETARNLGTTTQALSKMSAREQMSFVERYFSSIGAGNLARLRNGSQHDVNMAIFYPRAIGKGFNFNIAEDIRRTQSRGAANRFMKQNKGIKKAGDYTMKLTPPLPKLKPSENKKVIKVIEKSKEKELSSEEENFLKDVERQDPRSFMDVIKNLFIRDAGASERRIYPLSPDGESNRTAQQMENLFSEEGLEKAELDPDADKQTPTSPISQLSFKLPSKKDSDKIVDDMDSPPKVKSLSETIERSLARNPELVRLQASFNDPKEAIKKKSSQQPTPTNTTPRIDEDLAEFPEEQETKPLDYPTPTDAELDQKDMDFVGRPPRYFITKEGSFNQGDPFDKDDNLVRARFEREEMGDFDDPTPMGEADPRDEDDDVIGDFTFIKDLFRGGFDTDDDTDDDTDFFADEPMPMGGEADPKEDVANFEKGGEVKADFDGKDDEDEDEGDPPPLAKPEEVADDIPALLSEGEYVLPANVVRYIGLERIMDMHRQVLAEIQQMEDLGMIQNVDKNGEPEDDDDEMKFAEGEEGVTKGTIIIASAKPKGMMCPEPLRFSNGGTGDVGAGDHSASPDDDPGKDKSGDDQAGQSDQAGGVPGPDADPTSRGVDYSGGITDKGFEDMEKAEGDETTEDVGVGDYGGYSDVQGFMAKVMSTAPFSGIPGIADPQSNIDREKSEAEASQPGDMDLEIKEENIKQDKVDDVISDLITKNVYIEGVGYVPLASLMSPRDDVTV